jgi:hypothetical protein
MMYFRICAGMYLSGERRTAPLGMSRARMAARLHLRRQPATQYQLSLAHFVVIILCSLCTACTTVFYSVHSTAHSCVRIVKALAGFFRPVI